MSSPERKPEDRRVGEVTSLSIVVCVVILLIALVNRWLSAA
jgi:hypothetical protein